MRGGSGVGSGSLGTGQVAISSGSTFWNLPYPRMCFLLLSMKNDSWFLWGKFTSASAGMIHDPLSMYEVFGLNFREGKIGKWPTTPALPSALSFGIFWYLLLRLPLLVITQEWSNAVWGGKEVNLFSRVMVATGGKRSLYFGLVPVPLRSSLLEETWALKTAHRHRKRAGA